LIGDNETIDEALRRIVRRLFTRVAPLRCVDIFSHEMDAGADSEA